MSMPSSCSIEFFDHTADIGMRARASRFDSLIELCLTGLRHLLVGDSEANPTIQRELRIAPAACEYALFDAIAEALYWFATEQFLVAEIIVRDDGPTGYLATIAGETFDPARHRRGHEVKALTYHRYWVGQIGGEWVAEMVFDI